jgi:hypothetical protein
MEGGVGPHDQPHPQSRTPTLSTVTAIFTT